MKNNSLLVFFSLTLLFLPGCIAGPASGAGSPATATAQAQSAAALATRMAQSLQTTGQARTLSATATAQARQAVLEQALSWPAVVSDPFEDNHLNWPSGDSTDPLADIHWEIADGRYRWKAQANDSFVWWTMPDVQSGSDFYLAVTLQQTGGPPEGEAGLVFRLSDDDEQYYLYEVNQQGQFAVYIHDAEAWEALSDWQAAPAYKAGQPNRLGVIAQGQQLTFVLNNQVIDSIRDGRLSARRSGLLIGLSNSGDQGEWEFDDFEVRQSGD
jgi:hypothetical protein